MVEVEEVSSMARSWRQVAAVALAAAAVLALYGVLAGGLAHLVESVWRHGATLLIWLLLTLPVRSTSLRAHVWVFALGLFLVPAVAALVLSPAGAVLGLAPMSIAVVPPVEEALKLLPIALLWMHPGVRSVRAGFGIVDFAVLGLAAGAGFQVAEELLRVWFGAAPVLQYDPGWGPLGLFPHVLVLDGAAPMESGASGGEPAPVAMGHGVWTGLLCLALAVASSRGPSRDRWIPAGAALVLVLFEHLAFNVQATMGSGATPGWLRTIHSSLALDGRLSGWVFATAVLGASLWSATWIYGRRHPLLDVVWAHVRPLGGGATAPRIVRTAAAIRAYLQARVAALTAHRRYRRGRIDWPEARLLLAWCRILRDALERPPSSSAR